MFRKLARYVLFALVGSITVWFLAALFMVLWPAPHFTLSLAAIKGNGVPAVDVLNRKLAGETETFRMRDGVVLHAKRFGSAGPLSVVFLHGVMSSSASYVEICRNIHEQAGAEVLALDLRGHGESGGTPGDIQYIGQYEDDIADVIAELRRATPGVKVVLAGHSMGGGITMRYAAMHEQPEADGYLLFAPLLGTKSPTTRTETAPGADLFLKLDVPRTIGLVMLNVTGVSALNGLPTLFFNVPPLYPIHRYSFRAMASMTPDNYRVAMAADSKPLMLIVGQNDEAFHADRFASVVKLHRNGETLVVEGEGHDGVVRSAVSVATLTRWLRQNFKTLP